MASHARHLYAQVTNVTRYDNVDTAALNNCTVSKGIYVIKDASLQSFNIPQCLHNPQGAEGEAAALSIIS